MRLDCGAAARVRFRQIVPVGEVLAGPSGRSVTGAFLTVDSGTNA